MGAAGEVHTPEDGLLGKRIGPEQRVDEAHDLGTERPELLRERAGTGQGFVTHQLGHAQQRPLVELSLKRLQAPPDEPTGLRTRFPHARTEAPDLPALLFAEAAEGVAEPADEIAFCQQHVHGDNDTQDLTDFVQPLADPGSKRLQLRIVQTSDRRKVVQGRLDPFFGVVRQADRDEDTVERSGRSVLAQLLEKRPPFLPVLTRLVGGPATRRVDQDRVLGQKPIAIPGATAALQIGARARAVKMGKVQARLL